MNNNISDNKRNKKVIIKIIMLIVIILLLVCSCTATRYFGRIGKRNLELNKDINNKPELPIINNENLKFDLDSDTNITISGDKYKISYTTKGVKLKNLTCSTSDSKIATCYVEDGYIVVVPKGNGTVDIILEGITNDTRYQSTTTITVGNSEASSSNNDSNDGNNSSNGNSGTNTNTQVDPGTTSGGNTDVTPEVGDIVVDSDSRLKSLTVGSYLLKPSFNSEVYDYVVTVDSSVNKVNIKAKTNSNRAKILSGTGNIRLNSNSTIVSIIVEAEDGTTSTYTVKINKKDNPTVLSNDATLKKLEATNYTLNPTFESNTFNYVLEVGYNVNSLDLTAIANSEYANVTIKNNFNFVTGNNIVEIVVVAEDGTTNTYKITVNKQAKEEASKASLKDIKINGNSINNFDSNVLTYNVTVDSNTNSLNIEGIPEYDNTSVVVTGNTNLNPGTNTVAILVTGSDGSSKTYNIIVNKEKDSTNTLTSLGIKNYLLNEVFSENKFNYSVNVGADVTDLEVLYTKKDSRETVEITGNTNIGVSGSEILVKVIAEDGIYNTYKITVIKAIDLSQYYIYSIENYTLGYNPSNDNSKTIIINNNILEGSVVVEKTNSSITLTDSNNSKVVLTYNDLDITYIEDTTLSSLAFKVNYTSSGVKTINVTGSIGNNIIKTYDITLNITKQFNVVLDANNGFFTELSDKYEFIVDDGEMFDLSIYNTAYKLVDDTSCLTYKFIGYDIDKTSNTPLYEVDSLSSISITSDITLYAVYSTTDTTTYVSTNNRLYLTNIDLFVLEDGTKNLIYPGTNGSYVMRIKNTTNDKVVIDSIKLEENNICIDSNTCVNMGYKVRYTENNSNIYSYAIGSSNNYRVIYKEGTSVDANFNNLELNPGEETEITLFWMWAYSESSSQDNIDTSIGNYMNSHPNLTYDITVSFTYSKESSQCGN